VADVYQINYKKMGCNCNKSKNLYQSLNVQNSNQNNNNINNTDNNIINLVELWNKRYKETYSLENNQEQNASD
jgi:hypothetical protein